MQIKSFLLAVVIGVLPMLGQAQTSARAQLSQFNEQVQAASGKFSQQTETQTGETKAPQTGDFSFKRPGRFKWEIIQPYEQLIVSNGRQVMQYDPDLAQVTERSVDESVGASPAAILFGSGELEEAFEIQELPAKNGVAWLRAKPNSADAGFQHVDLGFKDGLPVELKLLDGFGQTTVIRFESVRTNPELPDDAFRFVVPDGVDHVVLRQ
ncbi:outer membrane lipoprotein carrier protein LolA [Pusillimonas sp. DMV24BSW_D]|uniref:outer membrane lipoprotein carrier protein LolA n=1 Tax=Neopusillimonas aestuarii TaxID=2716226 RepID=UPI00140A85FB|nr:outer membrane lipoprotein carrier protein LolA [Pusillimonas sp. DMV24BSW_D]QIM49035.1 outer membrane lipoprotein carrier protein LolA [Pusillimonas sp. DMV24BSW_D]